jgi:hypothetical protein
MLDFPLMFDNDTIPQPSTWTENSEVVETVNNTEAGTQQVEVVRYDRLKVNCGFVVMDAVARLLKTYSKKDSFVVKYYDIETDAYKQRTVRMRGFSAALTKDSFNLLSVRGVWTVSFTLEEF